MDETEKLRIAANTLLEKAQDATVSELASAVEKATGVLKLSCDLEKSRAETRKLTLEEEKLRYENNTASKREHSERFREYVSLLTPIVAIVTLAATLFSQTWQFLRSESERREAAETAQWEDAIKTISQTTKLSPGVVALNRFLKSKTYGDQAMSLAVQLLANSSDILFFDDLFGAAFVPINWDNLDQLVKLDRALVTRVQPLYTKMYNRKTNHNDYTKLKEPQEKGDLTYYEYAIPRISAQVASALQLPRPTGKITNLSAATFMSSDWENVDLSGANIQGINLSYIRLKGANLDKITQYNGAYFNHTAWWEAKKISPELLKYLEENSTSKYDPKREYGYKDVTFTPQQYADELDRLKTQNLNSR